MVAQKINAPRKRRRGNGTHASPLGCKTKVDPRNVDASGTGRGETVVGKKRFRCFEPDKAKGLTPTQSTYVWNMKKAYDCCPCSKVSRCSSKD